MTIIRPGDLWVANIPFTNGISSKKRPVLVLWLDGFDLVVASVTSANPRTLTDVILDSWAESGLRVASTVRLSRLDCLEQSLLLARIGKLAKDDGAKIQSTWGMYIKPDF